jgi:hypothetical protein
MSIRNMRCVRFAVDHLAHELCVVDAGEVFRMDAMSILTISRPCPTIG